MGVRTGAHGVLVGIPEGRRPLGRPRHRREDNIKWIFKKWDESMDWICVAKDRDRTGGALL
jgi:hypothetical protein